MDTNRGEIWNLIIRKGFIAYLIVAVIVCVYCYLLGWREMEDIGTGFLFGGMILVIIGVFMLAGNTLPIQLSNSNKPAAEHKQNKENTDKNEGSAVKGLKLFLVTLVGGLLLGATGIFVKWFW